MQHPRNKGVTIKNFWVIRRVGGLEGTDEGITECRLVIRRVGGLEDLVIFPRATPKVIRRVGGLEE